jgi:hypothetical protein
LAPVLGARATTSPEKALPSVLRPGIIFVQNSSANNAAHGPNAVARLLRGARRATPVTIRIDAGPSIDAGPEPFMRDLDPRDADENHVDLARGIAIGIVVGIVMWALAALILWAMWRG